MVSAEEPHDTGRHLSLTRNEVNSTTNFCSLFSLPLELLDIVVLQSLDLPTQIRQVARPKDSICGLFRSPILRVNHALRQKALDLIANETLWVSLVANTKVALTWLQDLSVKYLPVLPVLCLDAFQSRSLDTIHISFGNTVRDEELLEPCEDESPVETILLFNWTSFLRLSMEMLHYDRPAGEIHMRLPLSSLSWKRDFCPRQILPIFRLCTWPWFKLEIRDSKVPDTLALRLRLDGSTAGTFSLAHAFRTLRAARRFADELKGSGYREESILWLCYIGSIRYGHPQAILPGAFEWSHGELDIDPERTIYRESAPGRNPIGNEIRTLLHQLEYRACIGYWELYQQYGLDFISFHHIGLFNQGYRWRTSPYYSSFGLSDKERAEWHHLRAVDLHNRVNAYTKYGPDGTWIRDPYNNPGGMDSGFLACGMHYHSIKNMEIACSLQPESEEYTVFLDKLFHAGIQRAERFPDDPDAKKMGCMPLSSTRPTRITLPADVAAEAGITHWVGDALAYGHSGFFVFRYLPLAQKRLTEDQMQKLDETMETVVENIAGRPDDTG